MTNATFLICGAAAMALCVTALPSAAAAQSADTADQSLITTNWTLHSKPKRARPSRVGGTGAAAGQAAGQAAATKPKPRVFGGVSANNYNRRNQARSGARMGVQLPF